MLAARFKLAARRDPLGFIAAVAALLLVLLALLAPLLPIAAPAAIVGGSQLAPSSHHLFGTDQLGRDVFSRTIFGARHTLVTAVLATALAAAIGTPLGILAGYLTRWPSGVVMRVMDVLLAFPGLLLALVVVTILGPGVTTVCWPSASPTRRSSPGWCTGRPSPSAPRTTSRRPRRWGAARCASSAGTCCPCCPASSSWSSAAPSAGPRCWPRRWTSWASASGRRPRTGARTCRPGVQYLGQAWWISAAPGIAITVTILIANYLGDFLASMTDPDRLRQPRTKLKDTTTLIAGEG